MVRRQRHRTIAGHIAGRTGKREIPISGRRRLDVRRKLKVTEIERSGSSQRIKKALDRLKAKSTLKKELLVPQKDLDKAKKIAEKKKLPVLIQNLSKTQRRFIKK